VHAVQPTARRLTCGRQSAARGPHQYTLAFVRGFQLRIGVSNVQTAPAPSATGNAEASGGVPCLSGIGSDSKTGQGVSGRGSRAPRATSRRHDRSPEEVAALTGKLGVDGRRDVVAVACTNLPSERSRGPEVAMVIAMVNLSGEGGGRPEFRTDGQLSSL